MKESTPETWEITGAYILTSQKKSYLATNAQCYTTQKVEELTAKIEIENRILLFIILKDLHTEV